jgi:hypothetical protein
VGDHVFLKEKSNRNSLKLGGYSKLVARFCGPFEILERIVPVTYMLALLASMTVHNVFHVSLLKKYCNTPTMGVNKNKIFYILVFEPNQLFDSLPGSC